MSLLSREPWGHGMSFFLVLLCAETFVLGPLARQGGDAVAMINGAVYSALLLVGVLTLSLHPFARLASAVIVAAAVALRWASNISGSPEIYLWSLVCSLAAALCFLALILDQVYEETPVTAHKIMGAVAAYLLMATAFAFAYNLLEMLVPGSFTPFAGRAGVHPVQHDTFLYFSISTITTVGFGDVTAIHPVARGLVMLESVVGILYPPVLIGILVSLHTDLIRDRNGGQA